MLPSGSSVSYGLRWLQTFAFIALWMALGWALRLDGNSYLLIGVPLVVLFQLLVRRQPLAALWVRRASDFRLGRTGWIVGLLLAILPTYELISGFNHEGWPVRLWLASAIVGAFGAGFAFEHFDAEARCALRYGLLTAGLIGCAITTLGSLVKGVPHLGFDSLQVGVLSFLRYVPVTFLLEEVAFRGLLDSHLHQPGDSKPGWSAVALSAAWGLWHLPTLKAGNALAFVTIATVLALVHCLTGTFLSNTWRSCGNLLAPAIVHSFIDAVRNALLHHH